MGRSPRARLLVVAAFGLLVSPIARADERARAHLTYEPDPSIDRCPTERELRDAVAARLGYEPFTNAPAREVSIKVTRADRGIVASLDLAAPHAGHREIASPSGDCHELVDALAVAIAIGIDPSSLTRPIGEPPPPSPPPPPRQEPIAAPPSRDQVEKPPSPPQPAPRAWSPIVTAGIVGMFGDAPTTTGALTIGGGVRWNAFDARIEGAASLPARVNVEGGAVGGGRVDAALYTASLVPCGHVRMFFGCATLSAGAMLANGTGVPNPASATVAYSSVGLRAGVEPSLSERLFAFAYVDGVAPLSHVTLQLAHQDVWSAPSLALHLAAGAGARF